MNRPKNETGDFLLSITKIYKTPNKQTHTRSEKVLEFKLTKSRETFQFQPLILIDGSKMLGLTRLEIYNSIFNITEKNNKFKLNTDLFDKLSFEEIKTNSRRSLIFQILHHIIYNIKK